MSISLKSISLVEEGVASCVFADDSTEVTVLMRQQDLSIRATPDIFSWGGVDPRPVMQAVSAFLRATSEMVAWPQERGPLASA